MSSKLQLDVITTVRGSAIWWTRTKAKGRHGVVCRLNCVIHVWAPWGRNTCHLVRYINSHTLTFYLHLLYVGRFMLSGYFIRQPMVQFWWPWSSAQSAVQWRAQPKSHPTRCDNVTVKRTVGPPFITLPSLTAGTDAVLMRPVNIH